MSNSEIKICFFSARPFGVQGTPGTYLFLEHAAREYDCLIISAYSDKNIVHQPSKRLPIIYAQNLVNHVYVRKVLPAIEHFNPDIIYIFNYPEWYEVVGKLRASVPNAKLILDIKTPLLSEADARSKVQLGGNVNQKYLECILTLSRESVLTWIPQCQKKIYEYPLGPDLPMFQEPDKWTHRASFIRFVYIGSLSEKRKISALLDIFLAAADNLNIRISLDLYGRGPDEQRLMEKYSKYLSKGVVNFKGLVDQLALMKIIGSYDSGIAWVPDSIYSDSPSLKLIEFVAAGLPVLATNTKAHKKLQSMGVKIFLFEENVKSFSEQLRAINSFSFTSSVLRSNREIISNFDYRAILSNFIDPILWKIADKDGSQKSSVIDIQTVKSLTANCEKPLRIFVLSASLAGGKGGAERVSMEMANQMAHRGHSVYMSYMNAGHPSYSRERGVTLLPVNNLKDLRDILIKVDPDVFFCFYFNRKVVDYFRIVSDLGIPFCIQECTNPERLMTKNWKKSDDQVQINPFESYIEREALAACAHRIRLVMPSYKNSFPSYIQPRVRAFSNPTFLQPRKIHSTSSTEGVIVNIGGMKANKNLVELLSAFYLIAEKFKGWKLKVYGKTADKSTQPHVLKIRELISSSVLRGRVEICGTTDEIYSAFQDSDIHVISSLEEGCPTCVLEAMSCGVPSIGFDVCEGTNQLIKNRINGLLVSSDDRVKNLASALECLISQPNLRSLYGQAAHDEARNFDPDNVYDQWERLFHEAASYKTDPERLSQEQMSVSPERYKFISQFLNNM